MKFKKKALLLTPVFILMLVLVWAAPAQAGGSDAPTPYTVTKKGIQLPDGYVFEDNGHVNIRTDKGPNGIHFEALNNQPSGKWIGESFLPWTAFDIEGDFCIEWVQLSQFNEHFGEGGQKPVCTDGEDLTPKPTPEPDPTPDPTPNPETTPACGPDGSCGTVPDLTGEAVSAVGICEGDEFVTTTTTDFWEEYDGVRTYVGSDTEVTREHDPTCVSDVAPPATPVEAEAKFAG